MARQKKCSDCKQLLPIDAFSIDVSRPDGLKYHCRDCATARRRRYDEANREKVNAAHREYRKANRRIYVNSERKYSYGLSEEQYEALAQRADGKCEACGRETKLNVDHDKTTGVVRGLLCMNCNVGLGHFDHDVDRLWAAIDYLARAGMLTAAGPT